MRILAKVAALLLLLLLNVVASLMPLPNNYIYGTSEYPGHDMIDFYSRVHLALFVTALAFVAVERASWRSIGVFAVGSVALMVGYATLL